MSKLANGAAQFANKCIVTFNGFIATNSPVFFKHLLIFD